PAIAGPAEYRWAGDSFLLLHTRVQGKAGQSEAASGQGPVEQDRSRYRTGQRTIRIPDTASRTRLPGGHTALRPHQVDYALQESSVHSGSEIYQDLVSSVDADQTEARIFKVKDEIDRRRHNNGIEQHVYPVPLS